MNFIKVNLQYCHGINKLSYYFKFSSNNSCVIYAPNGTVKTSFTKTLNDLKLGIKTTDEIFTERESIRVINKSNGSSLEPSEVLIFESYKENYEWDKVTNLLIKDELKKEYDKIKKELYEKKNILLKLLEKQSGVTVKLV